MSLPWSPHIYSEKDTYISPAASTPGWCTNWMSFILVNPHSRIMYAIIIAWHPLCVSQSGVRTASFYRLCCYAICVPLSDVYKKCFAQTCCWCNLWPCIHCTLEWEYCIPMILLFDINKLPFWIYTFLHFPLLPK